VHADLSLAVSGCSPVYKAAWERLQTRGYARQLQVLFPRTLRVNFRKLFLPKGRSPCGAAAAVEALSLLEKTVHVNSCMWSRHVQQLAVCARRHATEFRLQIKKTSHGFSLGGCMRVILRCGKLK